jgi:uncharacterized protein (TIGR03435 family)
MIPGVPGRAAATLALSSFLASGVLSAQTAVPPKHRFEVASIRPSKAPDATNRLGPTPQGGLRGENVTVMQLIALAYGVRPFLIADAPGWASAERFDVVATPDQSEELPPNAPGAQRDAFRERVRQRIQALLADRFGLVIRHGERTMPVYKLVAAKSGHKMTTSTAQEPRRMESNSRMLRGTSVDMKTVADALAGLLLRPVIDETNLSGTFNLQMQFADVRAEAKPDGDGTAAATVFTAITEQLGLRLEAARAPSPVFIVEKVQRPSEN